jgi:hypothetical protein
MWRKVIPALLVGLLVSGLFVQALADKPPTRGGPGEGPKPFQWGDADWPAFSKDIGIHKRLAGESLDRVSPFSGLDRQRVGSVSLDSERVNRRSPSRGSTVYVMRVFGLTIFIRR